MAGLRPITRPLPVGGRWKASAANIIGFIERNQHRFYTQVGGSRAWVGVRGGAAGNKYIQTHADNQWNDNLLALRECS